MACQECDSQLDHCHETMVVHQDGDFACVEPDCQTPAELHVWVATCLELHWKCTCQRTGHAQPLAA